MAIKLTKKDNGNVALKAPYLNVDTGAFYDAGYTDGERAGYAKGYGEGYTEGEKVSYDVGYNKGYEDGGKESFELGKKAQYDNLWNTLQTNGNRVNYDNAFYRWEENIFYPKYNITPTRAYQMFYEFGRNAESGFDLEARLKECGVTLDTSKSTSFNYFVYWTNFSRVGTIDTTSTSSISMMIFSNTKLKTIEKLILKSDGSQSFSMALYGNSALENLTIEGVIGKNGFDVKDSTLLTHESLMSIINALQDKTGTSGTWTITLGNANIAKLTQEELDIIETKGWQVK